MSLVFNPFTGNFDEVSDLTTAVGASPNSTASTVTQTGTSILLTLQPVNTSNPGILTSTDWNTFNGKANATLNNLAATTAVNNSILPGADDSINLGNVSHRWNTLFVEQITFAGTAGINVNTSTLLDTSSNPSVLYTARTLQATNGSTTMLDWGGTDVSLSTHKLTNVVDPTSAQDAATKHYVDGLVTGGTVTSVALSDASTLSIYTISGSPVTTSGTLTLTAKTQTANTVFAGPTTGAAAQPTFRSLVAADIPSLSGVYVTTVNGAGPGAVTVNAINQITGDATAGPASGSQSQALTLATVNSNVGSFTYASLTVNAKGLITAASSGTPLLSNPMTTAGDMIYGGASGVATRLPTGSSGQVPVSAGSTVAFASIPGNATILKAPTIQKITATGAGTYTTPTSPVPLYLYIRIAGAGGGGVGGGSTLVAGTNGSATTFSTLTANGGTGTPSSVGGKTGGTASGGNILNIQGETGGTGSQGTATAQIGGYGGSTPLGGAGAGGWSGITAQNAIANTGSGGGGGGGAVATVANGGGGGGAGGYVEHILANPTTSYSYSVGTGGTGGTAGSSGNAAGNGSDGIIIIEEYYS